MQIILKDKDTEKVELGDVLVTDVDCLLVCKVSICGFPFALVSVRSGQEINAFESMEILNKHYFDRMFKAQYGVQRIVKNSNLVLQEV